MYDLEIKIGVDNSNTAPTLAQLAEQLKILGTSTDGVTRQLSANTSESRKNAVAMTDEEKAARALEQQGNKLLQSLQSQVDALGKTKIELAALKAEKLGVSEQAGKLIQQINSYNSAASLAKQQSKEFAIELKNTAKAAEQINIAKFNANADSAQSYYSSLLGIGNGYKSASESASLFAAKLEQEDLRLKELISARQSDINSLLGVERAYKSASDSAAVFKTLIANEDEKFKTNAIAAQAEINSLLGLDRTYKSAAGSAAVFKESFAVERVEQTRNALAKLGATNRLTANETLNLTRQLSDIGVTAAMGMNPLMILIQQGPQIADVFQTAAMRGVTFSSALKGMLSAAAPLAGYAGLLGVGAALYIVAQQMHKGQEESISLNNALQATGRIAGITESDFYAMGRSIGETTNTAASKVRSLELQIVRSGQVSGDSIGLITEASLKMAKAMGGEASQSVTKLMGLESNFQNTLQELQSQYHFLTNEQYLHIKALEEQGNKTQAVKDTVSALNDKLRDQKENLGFLETAWRNMGLAAAAAADKAMSWGRTDNASKIANLQEKIAYLNNPNTIARGFGNPYQLEQYEKELKALQEIEAVKANDAKAIARGQANQDNMIKANGMSASDFFRNNIIHQESGGRQFDASGKPLTSSKGAIGAAQVMPGTAREVANRYFGSFDASRYKNDQKYNEQIGELYFTELYQKYGDMSKAAAAYNAGPNRVDRALQKGGVNWQYLLPEETRNYVNSTIGRTGIKSNNNSSAIDDALQAKYNWQQEQERQRAASKIDFNSAMGSETAGFNKEKALAEINNQIANLSRLKEATTALNEDDKNKLKKLYDDRQSIIDKGLNDELANKKTQLTALAREEEKANNPAGAAAYRQQIVLEEAKANNAIKLGHEELTRKKLEIDREYAIRSSEINLQNAQKQLSDELRVINARKKDAISNVDRRIDNEELTGNTDNKFGAEYLSEMRKLYDERLKIALDAIEAELKARLAELEAEKAAMLAKGDYAGADKIAKAADSLKGDANQAKIDAARDRETAIQKIVEQSYRAQYQATTNNMKRVGDAWRDNISGLIMRTKSLHDVWVSMQQGMLNAALSYGQRVVQDFIAKRRAEAAAAKTAEELKTGIYKDGANKKAQISFKETIAQIKNDAAAAYAGVTKFMSHIVGPLAPVFGAAAYASVMALEGQAALFSAEGGYDVPSNGSGVDGKGGRLGIVHPREMVLPRSIADDFRATFAGKIANSNTSNNNTAVNTDNSNITIHTHKGMNEDDVVKAIIRAKRRGALSIAMA